MSEEYETWLDAVSPDESDLRNMKLDSERFPYRPKITIALVIIDGDEVWIKSSLNSILGQVYGELEVLCLDNGSMRSHVAEVLEEFEEDDPRVRVRRVDAALSYPDALTELRGAAEGEYLAIVSQGDELASEALFKVVRALQIDRADAVYTDEDEIDLVGDRSSPRFKPGWSPELMSATPYTGRLCLVRKDLLDEPGEDASVSLESSDHDMMMLISESTNRIMHIPGVLYHRRRLPSHADTDRYSGESKVEYVHASHHTHRSDHGGTGDEHPEVSVILCGAKPSRDGSFAEHLLERASHPVREVLTVDLDGTDSAAQAINSVARRAEGTHLVFLSGVADSVSEGWLIGLLSALGRGGAGAAGGKLTDSSGGIRQGGSYIEADGLALMSEPQKPEEGTFLPVIDRPYDAPAVSVECMIVTAETFGMLGGFDDRNLPTTLFDLDFSFRLRDTGRSIIYTPSVEISGEKLLGKSTQKELEFVWKNRWEHVALMLSYRWSPMDICHDAPDEETRTLLAVSDPIYRSAGS